MLLKEQSKEDSFYRISPEDFKNLVLFTKNNIKGLSKTDYFERKPLWITGDLDLSDIREINNLDNIKYIDGDLDISNTEIGNISHINVKGSIRDWNSKRYRLKIAAENRKKKEYANERRERGEWDIDNTDEEGIKANALFQYLLNEEIIDTLSEDEENELIELRNKLVSLEKKYDSDELEPNEVSELYDEIEELKEEIEELESSSSNDVYLLMPNKYNHYGLSTFEIIGVNGEYAIGTLQEIEDGAIEYAKNLIDDVGIQGFSEGFLSDYIDTDYFESWLRDFYNDDIYQNPDIYFTEDEFELTFEQEERKEKLETFIYDSEDKKNELEEKQSQYDSDSEEYEEIQTEIDDLESEIDDAQEELDSIEPPTEPTDEMIENKIDTFVNDGLRDPMSFINNFGLDLKEFIDIDELAQGYVDSDGYGIMNSYDGNYDTISFNDEEYYIMRIN